VIAVTDYKAPGEGTSFLTFLKGDLIILEEDSTGETVLNNGWCIGETTLTFAKKKTTEINNLFFFQVVVNELRSVATFLPKQFMSCQH
jgi:hypothetical protein